jgi:hypothetical protein
VPAAVNVMPLDAPLSMLGVVHDSSEFTVAVCAVLSLLVHVTVSPTFAVMVGGSNLKLAILTVTVPAVLDGAQAPAAADAALAGADAASLAGADAALAGAWLCGAADGAVVAALPPQAAARNMVMTMAGMTRLRDMADSTVRARSLGYAGHYVGIGGSVSRGAGCIH